MVAKAKPETRQAGHKSAKHKADAAMGKGRWVTMPNGEHIYIGGKPGPKEHADLHRAGKTKMGNAWRARDLMARGQKQFRKHKEAAKRYLKKGDAAKASKHVERTKAIAGRMEKLAKVAIS
jgi:hypothetical protein